MATCRTFLLVFALLSFGWQAFGQATGTISGLVTDTETKAPLPGANVAVGSTTLGAASQYDGTFIISDVPIGPWKLSASMVGYLARTEDAAIWEEGDTVRVHFRLPPEVYDLDEIEVTAERTRGWRKDFRRFKRLFLGESINAEQTVITNPYVLSFRTDDAGFYASASAPLLIENHALGYRLRYVLNSFRWNGHQDRLSFQGEPYFDEMVPENEEEAVRWQTNRGLTFRGSRQHFLWALARDRIEEEGFRMEKGAVEDRPGEVLPVREAGVITPAAIKGGKSQAYDYLITFRGYILISYEYAAPLNLFGIISLPNTEIEQSVMQMDANEAMIHEMGYFLGPPGALAFAGHWGAERVADLLPLDYVQVWEEHAKAVQIPDSGL